MIRPLAIALAVATTFAVPGVAQHATHTVYRAPDAVQEPGQGAFAAIAEIVALLRTDPATDWSRVDIAALRLHLQDMNTVALTLVVSEDAVPDGLRMTVADGAPGADAAQRMVPAHAAVLAAETGWRSEVEIGARGLVWIVTDPEEAAAIRALGFFGLLATGNHHPAHHLALARGDPMHR
ncbi:hypothetical protein KUH32_13930 [Thalassococcus sp. CAU 1522]|uniref:Uncharacterized protein n=1 Tax=Thalassococcus arenae TaxID=2851652 RepID=A0ABS6NA14_9RHOB|nr:hypothetical protein [Thalassococcus arenae]MBV2360862.1 hypothetical protein [Thalassococcus arenae]